MNNTTAAYSSSTNASASSMIAPSKAEGIAWCSALILTFIFSVVGNSLTIVLFAVNKTLRKKSLFLVINMAFADLMLAILSLSIRIVDVGSTHDLWKGTLLSNIFFSVFFKVVDIVFSQASLISAAMISCERFYAMYWPFKHRTQSMRAYRIVIFMVWTLAVLLYAVLNGLFYLTSLKHAMYAWMTSTLALTFIICGCNHGICRKFQHGGVALQQQNRASQSKRLTKTLLFVSIIALLSWLPVIITQFLIVVFGVPIPLQFCNIANLLYYSNSFVNPVVYALRIPEFRQALRSCCHRRQLTMNMELIERRNNRPAAMTPMTQLTLTSHLQLPFKQEVMVTKL